jgi:hypothetical protein
VPNYHIEDFLPVYGNTDYEKRMRVHQQWWGWERLKRPMGQPAPRRSFPVLTSAEQQRVSTSNFLTDDIYSVAMNTPKLSSDMHFNHLLSSLPMAVNLFGILIDPKVSMRENTEKTPLDQVFPGVLNTPFGPARRAHELVSTLIGHSVEVLRVDFEIPGRLHLNAAKHPLRDGTSADVLIEFRDTAGTGLIVIETKLSERLSNDGDLKDRTRNYLPMFDSFSSPFIGPMSIELLTCLKKANLIQWTRNQPLAFALEQIGGYSCHRYWTVFPSSHDAAVKAARAYSTVLKEPERTFADFTLEDIVHAWEPLLREDTELEWFDSFRKRYLSLGVSDALWAMLTSKSDESK